MKITFQTSVKNNHFRIFGKEIEPKDLVFQMRVKTVVERLHGQIKWEDEFTQRESLWKKNAKVVEISFVNEDCCGNPDRVVVLLIGNRNCNRNWLSLFTNNEQKRKNNARILPSSDRGYTSAQDYQTAWHKLNLMCHTGEDGILTSKKHFHKAFQISTSESSKGSHPFHFIELVAWYCSLFISEKNTATLVKSNNTKSWITMQKINVIKIRFHAMKFLLEIYKARKSSKGNNDS